MRHTQLLDALRDSLQDIENLRLIPEDDPQVAVKNNVRKAISEIEIENDGAPEHECVAA